MGFDDGRIILNWPNRTYKSGQTIHGNLIFQEDSVKTFRGIYVKLHGFCKIHWTTTETHRVNNKNETHMKDHDSYEEYINEKIYLVGGESEEHQIQAGEHVYSFTFELPRNCPSSFEGEYGHVRYEIKAVVDMANKLNQEKKVALHVIAPLDLNMEPYCREPIKMEINDTYYCCCFNSGSTNTVINIPMSGYCPGQKIPVEMTCTNKSTVLIEHIKLRIVMDVLFIATSYSGRKSDKRVIAEIKKSSIPGNTTRDWTIEMEIPTLDIYNLSGCKYIELNYKFEVVVIPFGCHSDSEESRKIIIGTIPIVGFQDNIFYPPQNQISKLATTVTQQPLPSYPVASPKTYADGNAPYPTISPYPNYSKQSPPYSVTTSHPSSNPPNPTNDSLKPLHGSDSIPYPPFNSVDFTNIALKSPYPAADSTYSARTHNIITNSPYPTNDESKSPYPAADSPYSARTHNTITNPPYPTNDASKSPYPAADSPYSPRTPSASTNPPYPTNDPSKSPYPAAGSPYSARTHSAITNPPYPTNDPSKSPYPAADSPYSPRTPSASTNPPYPTNDPSKSPYPAADSPYSPRTPSASTNPPYPTNDPSKSPYPAAESPYSVVTPNTITNPPYPTNDASKSPYPAADSPYSVGTPGDITNPPYPTNNASKLPYSAADLPYPVITPSTVTNPPYPSENSPYPDDPPPYPGNDSSYSDAKYIKSTPGTETNVFGSRLLKTGNIGFIVQGNSNVRNMPFSRTPAVLPTSPLPVNPFKDASAPALDLHDIEKNKENK